MRDFSVIPKPEVFTLHDLVHRLSLRAGVDMSPRYTAILVRAIQDAIRSLPSKNDWAYFKRQTRLTTSTAINPTVTYDHTGGAYEKMLTITSDHTWPADASLGEIVVEQRTYRIKERISTTVVTLEDDFSLQEDFTGDVWWQRANYQFTRDITRIHSIRNLTVGRELAFLPSQSFIDQSWNSYGRGSVSYFTWQNSGSRFGSSEICLWPTPNAKEIIEVTATVNPQVPKTFLESGTEAVLSVGSRSLTVADATFTKKLIGSVVRLSRNSAPPINNEMDNWDFQAFITNVPNATTLTLSEALGDETIGGGYAISSGADIEAATMLEYIEDEAYAQYCKNHDHKSYPTATQVAMRSLKFAIARSNSRISLGGYAWDYGYWQYDTTYEESL